MECQAGLRGVCKLGLPCSQELPSPGAPAGRWHLAGSGCLGGGKLERRCQVTSCPLETPCPNTERPCLEAWQTWGRLQCKHCSGPWQARGAIPMPTTAMGQPSLVRALLEAMGTQPPHAVLGRALTWSRCLLPLASPGKEAGDSGETQHCHPGATCSLAALSCGVKPSAGAGRARSVCTLPHPCQAPGAWTPWVVPRCWGLPAAHPWPCWAHPGCRPQSPSMA